MNSAQLQFIKDKIFSVIHAFLREGFRFHNSGLIPQRDQMLFLIDSCLEKLIELNINFFELEYHITILSLKYFGYNPYITNWYLHRLIPQYNVENTYDILDLNDSCFYDTDCSETNI